MLLQPGGSNGGGLHEPPVTPLPTRAAGDYSAGVRAAPRLQADQPLHGARAAPRLCRLSVQQEITAVTQPVKCKIQCCFLVL